MSKRLLVAFLAIGVLATSNAFASRARLLVMGTGDVGGAGITDANGNGGSLYFDDAYNVFYNPAYVNDFKNWGIIEKSNFPGASAQGGFVASFMNWNVGLYLNRVAAINGSYVGGSNNMRPLDIMIGSDMGFKWGLGATWATRDASSADDDTESELTLKAGASIADFEPFVHFQVMGNTYTGGAGSTAAKNKYVAAGLRYRFGEWTPYAAWNNQKQDDIQVSSNFGLGIGRSSAVSEGARMVYSVSAWRLNAGNSHNTVVPVDFAVEGDAMSWLTVRGGLNFALVSKNDASGSNTDSTTARVGATVHAGKADINWALGVAGGVGPFTEAGTSADAQVNGIGPGFFSAMSVAYRW